ncbi:NADH-quinone oxidoreductase subunit H [Dialister sp.]|uniref:NADH-quinone oxidoreductase subunit H n=1 Tax=Dialister sp. TaxID=1955814 RepID=UPI002E8036FA|nr:NADH-quinone oxidoreductase subunit H [Dialister sp.]MEE3453138.1 NADH-quinone oxidoreductase subunit H [Dialister sp.]
MSDFSDYIASGLGAILFLILGPFIGGLIHGLDRKISARMQRRVGPPLFQPFYDFLKLWSKQPIAINKAEGFYVLGFLIFVLLSGTFFFARGDILLVVFTLTMASVCLIIAAYASASPYAQVGAERELVQTMAYEPMLLMVALGFYLSCGSFNIGDIMESETMNFLRMPGIFLGLCYILLIKFRKSPFDISMSHEAHQELIGGVKTELSGRTLGMVELAEWYEDVFLLGLVLLFFISADWWTSLIGLGVCFLTFFLDILIDNSCGRIKWERMLASTWLFSFLLGFINVAFLMYFK